MSSSNQLNPVVRRFIEDAGNLTQSFGAGRVLGQIFAFLYFSKTPRNLGDMQDALGISKGSASMGVRQLEQWQAVRKVWIKGDRKDYYEASDWFGKIIKHAIADTVGKKMTAYTGMLNGAAEDLDELVEENGDGDADFIKERIAHLRKFHDKAQGFWDNPLLRKLLQ